MKDRRAILFGNGKFTQESGLENLQGPPNDVQFLCEVLKKPDRGDFEVIAHQNLNSTDLRRAIDDILSDCTQNDFILIYYAGHGRPDASGLYLATSDTNVSRLGGTALHSTELLRLCQNSNAGTIVLLLDCCYAGAIGLRSDPANALQQMAEVTAGLHILTATTGTQTAREREVDGDGVTMGAFTRQIVECLSSGTRERPNDNAVRLSDLEMYLQRTIRGQNPQRFSRAASGDPRIAYAVSAIPNSRDQSSTNKRLQRISEPQANSAFVYSPNDTSGLNEVLVVVGWCATVFLFFLGVLSTIGLVAALMEPNIKGLFIAGACSAAFFGLGGLTYKTLRRYKGSITQDIS